MKIVQKRLEQIIPGVSPESHHTLGTAGMRDIGFRVPIVLDQNGVAIKEHAPKAEAALRLGFDDVPCVYADDLTPAQIRMLRGVDSGRRKPAWFDDLVGGHPQLVDSDEAGEEAGISPRVIVLDENNTIINDDVRNMAGYRSYCSICDTVVFDHSFEDKELLDLLPHPSGNMDKLLLFSDAVHFDSVAVAVERGWRPGFEFVWDLCQCWLVPGRPLSQHKTCRVFSSSADVDFKKTLLNKKHLSSIYRCSNTALKRNTTGIQYEKPVEWVAAILKAVGARKVLDMFAGGGGIMMSCLQSGIPYCGFEIDRERCGIIQRRYFAASHQVPAKDGENGKGGMR